MLSRSLTLFSWMTVHANPTLRDVHLQSKIRRTMRVRLDLCCRPDGLSSLKAALCFYEMGSKDSVDEGRFAQARLACRQNAHVRPCTGLQHHPLTDHHDVELFRRMSSAALWACKQIERLTEKPLFKSLCSICFGKLSLQA